MSETDESGAGIGVGILIVIYGLGMLDGAVPSITHYPRWVPDALILPPWVLAIIVLAVGVAVSLGGYIERDAHVCPPDDAFDYD